MLHFGKDYKHRTKGQIDKQVHLELDQDEKILGSFLDHQKTIWKGIGNRKTDCLTITNRKVVFSRLVKAYGWPLKSEDSIYDVTSVLYDRIKSVTSIDGNNLKITIQDNDDGNEWSETFELRDNLEPASSLIKSNHNTSV